MRMTFQNVKSNEGPPSTLKPKAIWFKRRVACAHDVPVLFPLVSSFSPEAVRENGAVGVALSARILDGWVQILRGPMPPSVWPIFFCKVWNQRKESVSHT